MKRVLKLILFAALLLISAPSLRAQTPELKPPEKRSFKHGVKIFQDYVALADQTLVKSQNIRVMRDKTGPIQMSAEFTSPGQRIVRPASVLLEFISSAKSQRYEPSTILTLVVDGEEISFNTTNRVLFIYRGGFVETMVTPLPYNTFLRVANSRAVHVKLGPTEFTLDEKAMEVLRDVASRTGS